MNLRMISFEIAKFCQRENFLIDSILVEKTELFLNVEFFETGSANTFFNAVISSVICIINEKGLKS